MDITVTPACDAAAASTDLSTKARTHLLERLHVLLLDQCAPHDRPGARSRGTLAERADGAGLIAALTADARLGAWGYRLDLASVERLARLYAHGLMADPAVEVARLHYVPDAIPMYPDFPTQVMSMDEATYRLHQMLHYASTYGVERLLRVLGATDEGDGDGDGLPTGAHRPFVRQGYLPDVESTEKTRRDRALLEAQTISLAFSVDECTGLVYERLLARNERMTDADLALLAELPLPGLLAGGLADQPGGAPNGPASPSPSDAACLVESPGPAEASGRLDIPFRENTYLIVEMLYLRLRDRDVDAFVNAAGRVCRHPGDVLKYVMWRRSAMEKRQHFPTALRRRLVRLLESFDVRAFAENLTLDRERSLRALELLSYARFSQSPEHMRAVDALRSGTLRSWASAKEQAYRQASETGNHTRLLDVLSSRPGVMLREVGRLISTGVPVKDVLDAFGDAEALSFATLLTALARVDAGETLERRKQILQDRLMRQQASTLLRVANMVRTVPHALSGNAWDMSPDEGQTPDGDAPTKDEREARDNARALDALAAAKRAADVVARVVDELPAGRDGGPDALHPEMRELAARALAALGDARSRWPWELGLDSLKLSDSQTLMGLAYGCALGDLDSAYSAFMQRARACSGPVVDEATFGRMLELREMRCATDRIEREAARQVEQQAARFAGIREETARILRELLARKLAKIETPLRGRAVYLDADGYDLAHSVIMTNVTRTASSYFAPGLAMAIPEGMRRVRFFVFWDDRTRRVDLDLHAIASNGTHVGWNGEFSRFGMAMSGDVTTSENSVEYLDVDLEDALDGGVTSVDLTLSYFNGNDLGAVAQSFTGLLGVDDVAPDVELYNSANVLMRNDLADVHAKKITLCRIDVEHRCVVSLMGGSVPRDPSFTAQHYLETLIGAQGATLVKTRGQADVVLTVGRACGQGQSRKQGQGPCEEISLIDEGWFVL